MGNRGSKSIVCENTIVKEQRVDGSLPISSPRRLDRDIKYTLIGFERNHQFIILSNHINLINNRLYSTKVPLTNIDLFTKTVRNAIVPINPWALTGFIDGEGSFIIIISKNKNKIG